MEEVSLGNRYKECRPRRSSNCQTKILVGKDVLKELELRRSSPSVIAKLMGIDVLPPSAVAHNRHQEFKDVFEVSEEPPGAVRKERSHHFPNGLPSLKRGALKLRKLMPSKTIIRDDTYDSFVEVPDGLDRLNSVEINNPLFEKRPHDMYYSTNYDYEKDTARTCRKYPVGLANSSLSDFRNLSRGKNEDFSNIVVLEPSMDKGHDPENIFSIPYLSPVNKNCWRGTKHKQSEFPLMESGLVPQKVFGTTGPDVPRIRREKYLRSDSDDPVLGHEASFHQFSMIDASCSGSSQRYSIGNGNNNFRRINRSSSNSSPWKIRQHYEESPAGSKTLAEMFALSDSERLKLNSDSHAQIHHSKSDQNNGDNREGCFIVLPKHASPLSLRNSLDKNACLERPAQGRYNSDASVSYSNGKFSLDSFRGKPRLLKQIGKDSEDNMRTAFDFKHLISDNFSPPDCLNEKVLFTTDEAFMRQPAETEAAAFDLQLSRKQKMKRLPFHCHEYESTKSLSDQTDGSKSYKGLKEVEQPSPVSILEPLTDEDSSGYCKHDLQNVAQKRSNRLQLSDEPEVSMSSDDEDASAYISLEAFQVEEDRDFSYLLDILISSGIIVADWQLTCKSWYTPGCPVGPHVFNRLERKYNKISTWAKPERRLLFDLVNCILSEILAPCIDVHPWVQSRRQCGPLWGPEGPVEKVWQTIVRQREMSVIEDPDEMVLDPNWLHGGDDITMVGKQIARMLHGDLLEEVIGEFISELVVS